MVTRAKFYSAAEAGTDQKTTVHKIKTIQLIGQDENFEIPAEHQSLVMHMELAKNSFIANGLKSMNKREKIRNFTITLDADLAKVYTNSEGNVCYGNQYLDEAPKSRPPQLNEYNREKNEHTIPY